MRTSSPPSHRADDQVVAGAPTRERTDDLPGAAARTSHATKVYGVGDAEVRALDDVTVSFARGELTAIMGPSGSGKSTLLHCMAGLDRLTSGQTWIGTRELTGLSDEDLTLLRREHVGFVFQAYNLVPTLDARENIELPLRLGGQRPDPTWLETIIDALGLADRVRHRPNELSGGQQQRVAAARALASKPDLIFADEPTGNLDSHAATELLELIRRTVDDFGQTVVMVTHDPRAAAYADRVIFLADGRIVDDVQHPTLDRLLDVLKRLGS